MSDYNQHCQLYQPLLTLITGLTGLGVSVTRCGGLPGELTWREMISRPMLILF